MKRSQYKTPTQANPMTSAIIEQVISNVLWVHLSDMVWWRTAWRMSMEFHSMLRWQEVANLRWSDIVFTGHWMQVLIRASKTDQLGVGQQVDVYRRPGSDLFCPVELTRQYGRKLGFTGAEKDGSIPLEGVEQIRRFPMIRPLKI